MNGDSNETITVQNGTDLTVTGHTYANDTVILGTFPINNNNQDTTLSLQEKVVVGTVETAFFTFDTINVSGHAQIGDLTEGAETDRLTINIADHSNLTTTIHAGGYIDSLVVNGASSTSLSNIGDSIVNGATIDADVIGHGSWSFLAHPPGGGFLEFGDAVGHGQTVNLGFNSTLRIDQPDAFKGLINTGNVWSRSLGSILLGGVQADSWSYHRDMLTLMNNGTVVDRLRLEQAAGAQPFQVSQTSTGIIISGQNGGSGGAVLPEVNQGHARVAHKIT
jgi:hypothetical protein